ncbi:YDG/SRA domain-containing protein [uncultured Arthrobacter sp.]|uniref:YDG/SRA domain-containing protein n=1 Tax=uncultured Arthrobacter sp. TaxID=114050 RepID=UPI0028D07494|nr:YDG/SRA domain-containing protein [uncultured Arthrobacter sp.]
MSESSVFGEVDGVPVGKLFDDRIAVRAAGLHRHQQAGISGNYQDGADAIVVSGGYKDDRDHGDWILYTGQGGRDSAGRQVEDQTLSRGNKALVLSEERGLPVRVIRGAGGDPVQSPASGYRYDGLFYVVRHWVEDSIDGPLIYRYELRKLNGQGSWTAPATDEPQDDAEGTPPQGNTEPKRQASVVQRLVRNSAVTQYVKERYNYTCQFCGIRLEVDAGAYAEGAHIRPLGGKHGGHDTPSNVLCLCPNDHVLFDKGGLYLNTEHEIVEKATGAVRASLNISHALDLDSIAYHREHIAGVGPS